MQLCDGLSVEYNSLLRSNYWVYVILGVPRSASKEDIQNKFRRLALEYHPDRNKDPGAQDKFKEINAAYQVLSDPQKRAQYDRFGHLGVGSGGGAGHGFGGFDTGGGFGDIFEAFFGGSTNRYGNVAQVGRDIRARVILSFEEAVFGVEKEIDLNRTESCSKCNGVGAEAGSDPAKWGDCNGVGQTRRVQRSIFGQFSQVGPCRKCSGRGTVILNPCSHCRGSGREKRRRKIMVDIPRGVENGMSVRLSREGDAGMYGGPPGNLLLELHVNPHEIFIRKDLDVFLELPISFAQAALGDEIKVPTLDGSTTVKIPSGTQTGTELRIKGKGVSHTRNARRGDYVVVVNVITPKKLDKQQTKLFTELRETQEGVEERFRDIRNILDQSSD